MWINLSFQRTMIIFFHFFGGSILYFLPPLHSCGAGIMRRRWRRRSLNGPTIFLLYFPASVILLSRRYYEKATAKAQSERPYYTDKSSFAVSRGQKWVLENKRPERLRHVRGELMTSYQSPEMEITKHKIHWLAYRFSIDF